MRGALQENSLLSFLEGRAAQLVAIDQERAIQMLLEHLDSVGPAAVVPSLLAAMQAAESSGDESGRETWRRRLYEYLNRVFRADPGAGADYAELQLHLYADYAPAALMDFLVGSEFYPLEAALAICQQRRMVDEQASVGAEAASSSGGRGHLVRAGAGTGRDVAPAASSAQGGGRGRSRRCSPCLPPPVGVAGVRAQPHGQLRTGAGAHHRHAGGRAARHRVCAAAA